MTQKLNVGLYPFDPQLIWTKANLNLGGALGDEAARIARVAAQMVINEGQNKRQRTVTGRCTVRQNQLCSPEALIEANEALEAETLNRILTATCRSEGCDKKSRGGKAWKTCPCGAFKLCSKHKAAPLLCPCIQSPPPLDILVPTAQQSTSNIPSTEPTPLPRTTSSSAQDAFDSCPVCQLLLVDGETCHNCSYHGHSNPSLSLEDSEDDFATERHSFSSPVSFLITSLEAQEGQISSLALPVIDEVLPAGLQDDILPQASVQTSGGKCTVCGFYSRALLFGRCQKQSCQSFTTSSQRLRRAPIRELSYL
jgi:hypothetical protein